MPQLAWPGQQSGLRLARISALVDDLVDFALGRMGGGIAVNLRREGALDPQLGQVIAALRAIRPEADIVAIIPPAISVRRDAGRLCQLPLSTARK